MRNLFKSSFLLTAVTVLSLATLRAEAALLVAGRGNGSVLRYDEQTGDFINTFIPAGRGGLEGPSGLAFGPDNNLYVADYFNSRVLRYDGETGDFIDTFIPSGSGGLSSPETLEFGPDNDLYISGLDGSGVLRYDGQTGAFIETVVPFDPSTGDRLNSPNFTFGFGSDNDLFVSSVLPTGGVLRYDEETDTTDVFIPPSSSPEIPGGLTFGPNNNLYVTSFVPNASVRRYDGETGDFVGTFVSASSSGLSKASRLTFGPDDNLYVSSFGSNSVLRYDGDTGAFIDAFVPSGSGGLSHPIGFVFSPTPVPEPTSYLGILGFGAYIVLLRRSKANKKSRNQPTLRAWHR